MSLAWQPSKGGGEGLGDGVTRGGITRDGERNNEGQSSSGAGRILQKNWRNPAEKSLRGVPGGALSPPPRFGLLAPSCPALWMQGIKENGRQPGGKHQFLSANLVKTGRIPPKREVSGRHGPLQPGFSPVSEPFGEPLLPVAQGKVSAPKKPKKELEDEFHSSKPASGLGFGTPGAHLSPVSCSGTARKPQKPPKPRQWPWQTPSPSPGSVSTVTMSPRGDNGAVVPASMGLYTAPGGPKTQPPCPGALRKGKIRLCC